MPNVMIMFLCIQPGLSFYEYFKPYSEGIQRFNFLMDMNFSIFYPSP